MEKLFYWCCCEWCKGKNRRAQYQELQENDLIQSTKDLAKTLFAETITLEEYTHSKELYLLQLSERSIASCKEMNITMDEVINGTDIILTKTELSKFKESLQEKLYQRKKNTKK